MTKPFQVQEATLDMNLQPMSIKPISDGRANWASIRTILFFSVILLIRFFFCVGIGILWFLTVPFVFYMKTPHLDTLEGYYIHERVDDDLLEFYSITKELENYGGDNKPLAEKVILVGHMGTIGLVWGFPALGIIWGLNQKRDRTREMTETARERIKQRRTDP